MLKLGISSTGGQYLELGFKLGWCCAQLFKQETLQSLEFQRGKDLTFTDENNTPFELASSTEYNKKVANLLDEVDEYYNLPAGWDNETDEVTNPKCLDFAKQFISLLNNNCIVPEFSAGSGEEVALYWDNEKFYLIVHFFESGKMRYYYEEQNTQNKASGLLNGLNSSLPQEIAIFISR